MLKSNIDWQVALSKNIVFMFIAILVNPRHGPTEKGHCFGRVLDFVYSGVIVPLPSRLVEAIMKFSFSHYVRLTNFGAALAYIAFRRTCKLVWDSVPSLCYPLFFPYSWRRTIISDCPAVDSSVKRSKDWTEYCEPRQKV